MTLFFGLILVLAAAVILFPGRRVGRPLAVGSIVAMFLWGWGPGAALFSRTLEGQFPFRRLPPDDASAIVVLSGSFYPPDRSQPETLPGYGTYLRCHHAARLYTQWKAVPVIVTTGPVRRFGKIIDTAPAMKQVLEEEGVPASMIWTENQSLTTYENALHTAVLLNRKGIHRIVLVTEAFHMPRAYWAFRGQGISVLPSPCAYYAPRFEATWKSLLIPRPVYMEINEINLHEWVGLVWYKLSGKF